MVTENEIVEFGKRKIKADSNTIEPKEYFKILKGKKQSQNSQSLQKQLETVAELIIKAKSIGQNGFLEKLVFTHEVIIKEQTLLSEGIDTFLYKDDVKFFIDKIHPKNSIKIIELERYPRGIPINVMERVAEVQKLELFDEYLIIFTDFTGVRVETEEEKKFIAKNKDPVVLGMFKHTNTGIKHDRLYFIADWEDENCDLTFTKMLEKMKTNVKMDNPERKINTDTEYLNEIIYNTLSSMEKGNRYGKLVVPKDNNQSLWNRLWPFKKKK